MDSGSMTPMAILEAWSNDASWFRTKLKQQNERTHMKNILLGSIAVLAATLLSPHAAQAQGTTVYLSSLSQTYTGARAVGSDSWLTELFVTGSNPGGYTLDSIRLGMADAAGIPSGFAVMLYADAGYSSEVVPGSSLGSLTGSASPSTAGVYSYTPAANLTLSPGTPYFVVLAAGTAVAAGAYNWGLSAYPPASSEGWSEGNGPNRSANGGSTWSAATPYQGIGQLAIYATPVPEPGVLSLAILGSLLLCGTAGEDMKHIVLGSVAALVVALSPYPTQAQGTPYLSSLSQTYTGNEAVGSDSWLAERFSTGASPGGYVLNSIQLGMADASGSPSGFAVMLYSESSNLGAALPGSSLGSLAGVTSPSTAGVYSYTSAV